jgi:hypothetical protein
MLMSAFRGSSLDIVPAIFVANKPAVQWIEPMPLCDEDKIKILSGNATRLFRL